MGLKLTSLATAKTSARGEKGCIRRGIQTRAVNRNWQLRSREKAGDRARHSGASARSAALRRAARWTRVEERRRFRWVDLRAEEIPRVQVKGNS